MTRMRTPIPTRSTFGVCRFLAKLEIIVSATPTLWDKELLSLSACNSHFRISVLVVLRHPLPRRSTQKTPQIFFENVCWLAAAHAEHGFRLLSRSSRLSCIDDSRACPPGARHYGNRCPAAQTRNRSGGFIWNVARQQTYRITAPRGPPRSVNCFSHSYDIHATTMLQSPTTSR